MVNSDVEERYLNVKYVVFCFDVVEGECVVVVDGDFEV